MKILIRFGDNDFSSTLRAFGELFLAGREWNYDRLTKANLVSWFNRAMPVLYELVQANDRPIADLLEQRARLAEYLTITEERVFLGDEEVDRQMNDYARWSNHDALLIDLGAEHPRRRHATVV